MEFKRLTNSEDEFFDRAMSLYRQSFPYYEQREERSQREIMRHGEYHFNLIFDGAQWVGIMLFWETEEFIYVEHFCIFPELRNMRYGQRALENLGRAGKSVILEIDPPVDSISRNRKQFYERCGFVENGFSHVHPPYHTGVKGHELVVMSKPEELSQREYDRFKSYLENTVMPG